MTTQSQLAALDAAATQGEWIAAPYSSVVGAPIVASPSGRSIGKITYFNLGEGFASHDAQSEANGQLIVALVNAFRANKLVLVPSVEEVAADIACNSPSGLQYPWHTAAALQVLASMGAKTDG